MVTFFPGTLRKLYSNSFSLHVSPIEKHGWFLFTCKEAIFPCLSGNSNINKPLAQVMDSSTVRGEKLAQVVEGRARFRIYISASPPKDRIFSMPAPYLILTYTSGNLLIHWDGWVVGSNRY